MDTCGLERVERFRINLNEKNFASQKNTLTSSLPQRFRAVGTYSSGNDTLVICYAGTKVDAAITSFTPTVNTADFRVLIRTFSGRVLAQVCERVVQLASLVCKSCHGWGILLTQRLALVRWEE